VSFIETIERARALLERNSRLSLRALQREFDLDDDALDELVDELIEIQRVAVRDGRALAWAGAVPPAPTETREHERAPRDYTPKHLADKILRSKSALEGERKQVTVLFADVKGSMELAEQVDPEEWHAILDRFFQILADGVHRFEGTVNQYTGDGIMALFGAPIAHEDHAQRACYAALHLSDELRRYANELRRSKGLNFSVRLGLNSGEVVVGKIGDDLRMDYTAQGHTVGLGARMEQLAEPGKIYLTERTASLGSGYFELEDLGEFDLAGASERIRVQELRGVGRLRTRLDLSRSRGFSRFVGRADEMATLELALHRATEGSGQVVGVVGEAGVGKSRLCLEFVERCREKGIAIHEAHCPSHGKTVPFLPLLELLRDLLGVSDRQSPLKIREAIAGRLLLLDLELEDFLPLVFDFLGVTDPERRVPVLDPDTRQRRLFAFVRRLVESLSTREPTLILIDDLHWIDAASDAFLAQIVEAVGGSRSMLLVNFRPEYRAEWTQRSYYQQLPLAPLGRAEIAELLRDLLGPDESLVGLQEVIRERTEGNPFFTEEVVHALAESEALEGTPGRYRCVTPIERIEVPETVQAVLAARIDRLPEREKRMLQTAAVIGRGFEEATLEAVADLPGSEVAAALAALQAAEFVRQGALYPRAEYAFRHALTHQVAYESQLGERRARGHAAVARAIEAASPERHDEQAALLARHWEEAGESLEAARWHRRAAQWIGASDLAEAARHWQQVRTLVGRVPATPDTAELGASACAALLRLGWRVGGAEELESLLREGLGFAELTGDARTLALLHQGFGVAAGLQRGEMELYAQHSREAVNFAVQTGDRQLVSEMRSYLMYATLLVGGIEEALSLAEELIGSRILDAAELEAAGAAYNPHLAGLHVRGQIRAVRGDIAGGEADFHRAVSLAREAGDHTMSSWSVSALVFLAELRGESGRVLEFARSGVESAERLTGSVADSAGAMIWLGTAHLLRGEWEPAFQVLDEALRQIREARVFLHMEGDVLRGLASALQGVGEAERAVAVARQATQARQNYYGRVLACCTLARILRETQGAAACSEIERALDDASQRIRQHGYQGLAGFEREERARLAQLLGDPTKGDRELREVWRLYTDMGATGHAERLARELAELGSSVGE
jgi:class 3 adenylate cyclase/tetratricopeptide (TPR) repeat protein